MYKLTTPKKIVLGLSIGAIIFSIATLITLRTVNPASYTAAVALSKAPTLNPNCIISMESPELNPAYITSTIATRKFTPQNMPVTVLDDIVIKYDTTQCVRPAGTGSPYNIYYLKLTLVTTNISGGEVVIATLPFVATDSPTGNLGGTVYNGARSWNINLSNLVTTATAGTDLELLIDSIAKNRPVKIKIANDSVPIAAYGAKYLATFPTPEKTIAMTNCYQAYGNGENKVIMMRPLVTTTPAHLLADVNTVKDEFLTTSPFKQNIAKFSFFIDLRKINENTELNQGISASLSQEAKLGKILSNIGKVSSCGDAGTHVLRSTIPGLILANGGPNLNALTSTGSNNIIIDLSLGAIGSTVMHEFGHSFAKLKDEYQLPTPAGINVAGTNCSQNPSVDYKYSTRLYGATNISGCRKASLYRPSDTSIMSNPHGPEFNTVSCGYILARINNNSNPKSYFPTCNTMPGITHYP